MVLDGFEEKITTQLGESSLDGNILLDKLRTTWGSSISFKSAYETDMWRETLRTGGDLTAPPAEAFQRLVVPGSSTAILAKALRQAKGPVSCRLAFRPRRKNTMFCVCFVCFCLKIRCLCLVQAVFSWIASTHFLFCIRFSRMLGALCLAALLFQSSFGFSWLQASRKPTASEVHRLWWLLSTSSELSLSAA